jgi:predicted glycosyltransferase
LMQKLIENIRGTEVSTVFFGGRPDKTYEMKRLGNFVFFNHLSAPVMKEVISSGESIISRSGYSSIMDLISLNCSALLIPTPGQTEQEYLAVYLSEKGWFSTLSQNEISPEISFPSKDAKWTNEIVIQSEILLNNAIKELLEKKEEKR